MIMTKCARLGVPLDPCANGFVGMTPITTRRNEHMNMGEPPPTQTDTQLGPLSVCPAMKKILILLEPMWVVINVWNVCKQCTMPAGMCPLGHVIIVATKFGMPKIQMMDDGIVWSIKVACV